ncbi:protein CREG2 isoform X3 [Drosophila takahashii]|uniref:protein CREG2 isoform X3 n=1 Tax=Drosophila takahashii TaxID=29030 RepID=UPI0038993B8C
MPCSRSFSCPVISDLSKPNRYTCSPAMKPCPSILLALILAITIPSTTFGYSPREDARVISEYKRNQDLNHAKIARDLVHRANWGALGSLSTDKLVQGYPMVNIISIDDSDANDNSTGRIHFLLTDLDFTGPDWQKDNKVTFLFSDEQTLRCKDGGKDPMEPTCARSMISGQVKKSTIFIFASWRLAISLCWISTEVPIKSAPPTITLFRIEDLLQKETT